MNKTILVFMSIALFTSSACQFRVDMGSPTINTPLESEITTTTLPVQSNTITSTSNKTLEIDDGFDLLFAGEVDKAIAFYEATFTSSAEIEDKSSALLGLGKAQMLSRNYQAAADTFNRLLGLFSGTTAEANAYFLLGQCYEYLKEPLYAANAYAKYVELKPGIIDGYVRRLQGDSAMDAGDYRGAIYAYQSALNAEPAEDFNYANLQIGKAYMGLKDYTTAIQVFLSVYENAQDDYTRATANLLAGQSYLELDRVDDAHARFMESVLKYPKAYDSFTALNILVSAGVPVDELQRGIVDYYAGSYDFAISAFKRFLDSNTMHDGTVYFYKGLSHFFRGETGEALEAYQKIIDDYPGNIFWPNAWDEKAYILWTSKDQYSTAANTLLDFVEKAPNNPNAPVFMYEAARILERGNLLTQAAGTWERLMDSYPGYDQSYRALFLSGITRYRLAEFESAYTLFQRTLVLATNSAERAAAYLWMGKVSNARKDDANAKTEWDQAQKADPTDYYGIRAGELLSDTKPFTPIVNYDLGYDLQSEKAEADTWIRANFNIVESLDLNDDSTITQLPEFKRAKAFWEIGLFNRSTREIESIRKLYLSDGLKLYQLTNLLLEMRLYKQAILTCRDLLNLRGLDDLSSLAVPIYFSHIRFGAYFRLQVTDAGATYGVDPLILFSLLRQESLFEPFVTSSAGAGGIAQIMPATGKEIADRLNWPSNYSNEDVYLAKVSIIFGASYLARQIQYFGGNYMLALAAYNSGAGNVNAWAELASNDADLLLEIIRFEETQNYLKQIGEFFNIYKLIYYRIQ